MSLEKIEQFDCLTDVLEALKKELKKFKTAPPTFFPSLSSLIPKSRTRNDFNSDLNSVYEEIKATLQLSYESKYLSYVSCLDKVHTFVLKHFDEKNPHKFKLIGELINQGVAIKNMERVFSPLNKSIEDLTGEFEAMIVDKSTDEIDTEELQIELEEANRNKLLYPKTKTMPLSTEFPMWAQQPPSAPVTSARTEGEIIMMDDYQPAVKSNF